MNSENLKYKLLRIHALMNPNPLVQKFLSYTENHRNHVKELASQIGIPSRGEYHDLDKYDPQRLISYAKYHEGDPTIDDINEYEVQHYDHIHSNDHHPQYWYDKTTPMSLDAWLEMICDWIAAGIASSKHYKSSDTLDYYSNYNHQLLDPLPGIKEATEEFLHKYAKSIDEFNRDNLVSIYNKYVK